MPTFYEMLGMVENSSAEEWTTIPDGPTFLEQLGEVQDAKQRWIEVHEHHSRAVYIPDVQLGLAWGMSWLDDQRSFEWASFPDPSVYRTNVDVLWNGALVHRYLGLVIDGGRARIPFPELNVTTDPPTEWFKAGEVRLFGTLHELEGAGYDYDSYIRQTGLAVR